MFQTPPRSTKPKKETTISPSKQAIGDVREKIHKPSQSNPFAKKPKQSEEVVGDVRENVTLHKASKSNPFAKKTKHSEEEEAADALRHLAENAGRPNYDIHSDPNYEKFHKWANTTKSVADDEGELLVTKANGTLPTADELRYIKDIQPYLLAYKIHCKKFSTTYEQLEECYPIYLKIKQLLHEYKDSGIKFFRSDRPNEELIHMVHFPLKKTKKAHSLKKKSRSTRKQLPHSRGGKTNKISKNRK
jgi:hypothetical protein